MNSHEQNPPLAHGIAAVERETGLSKDLLRVWERRYGFPTPHRDALGERLYPQEQLLRLRLIKRLLDAGHRPHQVVALPHEALQERLGALMQAPAPAQASAAPEAAALDALLAPLLAHDLHALHDTLQAELLRLGLQRYVVERLAPLVRRVGELWSLGQVQIHEEHLFTEAVQQQLRRALSQLQVPAGAQPRVLLSTLPGEEHGLGLLMVHCLLAVEGCECRSLGLQTPVSELVLAVQRHRADVLALSFSSFASAALVEEGLQALHLALPAGVDIWAGGSAAALRRPLLQRLPRVRALPHLSGLGGVVEERRSALAAGPDGALGKIA